MVLTGFYQPVKTSPVLATATLIVDVNVGDDSVLRTVSTLHHSGPGVTRLRLRRNTGPPVTHLTSHVTSQTVTLSLQFI